MEFPDEIWQLILNNFDVDSLKNCLLWSKYFRELVIKTPTLMIKLPVIFTKNVTPEKLLFVKNNGKFIKSLKFDNCFLDLADVLELTPNIEEIVCEFPYSEESDYENNDEENIQQENAVDHATIEKTQKVLRKTPLNLPKLIKIEIFGNCKYLQQIIPILANCVTLKHVLLNVDVDGPQRYLEDFILQQDQLETLKLDGYSSADIPNAFINSIFTEKLIKNCKFKLKNLILKCEAENDENLACFLIQQADTIQELTFPFSFNNFQYFQIITNNFSSLKKLQYLKTLMFDEDRIEAIENIRMPSITEIDLVDYTNQSCKVQKIIEMFPNLEVLRAEFQYFNLREVFKKLPKLKKLSVVDFRIEAIMFCSSDSLEILEIENLHAVTNESFLKEIAKNFPNIEKINIKRVKTQMKTSFDDTVRILLESLKLFEKLRYFKLFPEFFIPIANDDEDNPEMRQQQFDPNMEIEIETKIDGGKVMKLSGYFESFHRDLIENVIKDLKIEEIVKLDKEKL